MEEQDVVLVHARSIKDSVSELPPKQNPEFLEHSIHWIEDGCLDPKFSQGSRRGRTQVLCLLSLSGLLVLAGLAWVALTVYFETVAEPWAVVKTVTEETGLSTSNSFDVYLIGADQITLHPEFSLLHGGIYTDLTLTSQRIRSLDGSPLYSEMNTQEFRNQNDRKLFTIQNNKTEPLTEILISHSQGLVVRKESLKTLSTRKPMATVNYRVRVSKSQGGPFETVVFQRSFEMFTEEDILPFAKNKGLYFE